MRNIYCRCTYFFAALIAVLTLSCSPWGATSIPKIKFEPQSSLITITSWRIIGPFKLPDTAQSYTLDNEEHALTKDYLADIGGSESPFKIGDPTTQIDIDFDRDATVLPSGSTKKAANHTFLNQTIDFPIPQISSYMIFDPNSNFFKVMYAVSNIISDSDTDMHLIVSGNSPVKIWINNVVVAMPPGGSVGNAQQIQHLAKVRLKKGNNYLVAKMFCFPLLNEFSVRLAGEKAAQWFITEKGGLRDLLEHIIVAPGIPLRFTKNLLYFNAPGNSEYNYEILSAADKIIIKSRLNTTKGLEASTQGLPEGLYTLSLEVRGVTRSHPFYIGSPDKILAFYKTRCTSSIGNKGSPQDRCLSLAGLQEIHKDVEAKGFRQDWQKKAILYASMIETDLNRNPHGFRMHAYRSRVDGQNQYYLFYVPRTYKGNQPLPMVIEVPHNAYGQIAAQDPEALLTGESIKDPYYKIKTQSLVNRDANYLLRLALFCDEYGYACLFPFARLRQFEDPLAITDMFEVLDEVKKIYPVDKDRIYLRGFCRGGGNAIKLAEHFPDQFSAVSSINLSVNPEPFLISNKNWQEINDVRSLVENLGHVPLQLIHGKHFPHSPTKQSREFESLCKEKSVPAQFELFEGDTQWDDRDEYRISFDFFRNKKRKINPSNVTYVTGQLKYSSAYWVRIISLIKPATIGRVAAQREANGRISLSTQNVGEVEIIPGNTTKTDPAPLDIDVIVNGQKKIVRSGNNGRAAIRIQSPPQSNSLCKTNLIEGPIAHALAEPFILVQGTGGAKESQPKIKRTAEDINKYWTQKHLVNASNKYDYEVSSEDLRNKNIILIGEAKSNTILRQTCDRIPISIRRESIKIGDKEFIRKNYLIVVTYPNPDNANKYILLINSNNPRAFYLPEPDLARYGADLAIWEWFINGKSTLVGQWIWDNSWQHLSAVSNDRQK